MSSGSKSKHWNISIFCCNKNGTKVAQEGKIKPAIIFKTERFDNMVSAVIIRSASKAVKHLMIKAKLCCGDV